MKLTEKQQEKFGKEMETNLHRAMSKAEKAPQQELAAIQLEEAKKLLKDTEIGAKLVPTEDVLKHTPEYKSDVTPEVAEKHFKTVNAAFQKSLAKYEHLNPEGAEKIRNMYGLKKGKSWTVGIDLKKNKN